MGSEGLGDLRLHTVLINTTKWMGRSIEQDKRDSSQMAKIGARCGTKAVQHS